MKWSVNGDRNQDLQSKWTILESKWRHKQQPLQSQPSSLVWQQLGSSKRRDPKSPPPGSRQTHSWRTGPLYWEVEKYKTQWDCIDVDICFPHELDQHCPSQEEEQIKQCETHVAINELHTLDPNTDQQNNPSSVILHIWRARRGWRWARWWGQQRWWRWGLSLIISSMLSHPLAPRNKQWRQRRSDCLNLQKDWELWLTRQSMPCIRKLAPESQSLPRRGHREHSSSWLQHNWRIQFDFQLI